MRAYVRTSRRTAVSMPWWLAIPVALVWMTIWLAIVFYGLLALALMFIVRTGHRAWRRHRY